MTRKLTQQEINDLMYDFMSTEVEVLVQAVFDKGFKEGSKRPAMVYDGDGNCSYLRGEN